MFVSPREESSASSCSVVSTKSSSLKQSAAKQVRFNECVTVHPIRQKSSKMSVAERNELYYTKGDVAKFRSAVNQERVKVLNRARSLSSTANPDMSSAEHVMALLFSDPDLRGLGLYICPTRNRNKFTIMSTVRKYQRRLFNSQLSVETRDECLAEAYSNLSHWSKINALETARLDFLRAYGQTKRNEFKEPIKNTSFPELTRKRKRTDCY